MIFDIFINGICEGTVGLFDNDIDFDIGGILVALIFGSLIVFCAFNLPFLAINEITENHLIQQFFDGTISKSDYYSVLCVIILIGITFIAIVPYVGFMIAKKYKIAVEFIAIQTILYTIVMEIMEFKEFTSESIGLMDIFVFIVAIFSLALLGIVGGRLVSIITCLLSFIIHVPLMIIRIIYVKIKLKHMEFWKTIETNLHKQEYEKIRTISVEKTCIEIFDRYYNKMEQIEFNVDVNELQFEVLYNLIKTKIPEYFYVNKKDKMYINKIMEKELIQDF